MSTAPAGAPLVARTVPLPDPGDLLARLPADGALSWLRDGEGLVGWGQAARFPVAGPDRFADADAAWAALTRGAAVHDDVRVPGTGPVAFASFAFSADSADGGVLVVPEVVLGHRDGTWWLTTTSTTGVLPAAPDLAAEPRPTRAPGPVSYVDGAVPGPQWRTLVDRVLDRIGTGAVDKVVLARDVHARTDGPVDLRRLLHRLADRYPTCWTFTVEGLVGATPELLVRREQGQVTSRVLAGTVPRTGDDARDLALAASLAHSGKDLEEHEYAVRSVTDALAAYCVGGDAPRAPYVLRLPNVLHLATDVTGVLADVPARPSAIALAAALHPTAAVCGTPTAAAAQVIAELEGMDRGRYSGPVGWVDAAGDGEFGIALRCAQVDPAAPDRLRLFAGCGIVAGSDPVAELVESDAKLLPMRDALA